MPSLYNCKLFENVVLCSTFSLNQLGKKCQKTIKIMSTVTTFSCSKLCLDIENNRLIIISQPYFIVMSHLWPRVKKYVASVLNCGSSEKF